MFFGEIDNYLIPAGEANTPIPIKTLANTNDRIVNNRGTLSFLKNGDYNVDATISVSAAETQDVNVSIYADDGIRRTVLATIPAPAETGEAGTANVALLDAIKVKLTRYFSVANIYIAVDQSDVTVSGYIRVEYVR